MDGSTTFTRSAVESSLVALPTVVPWLEGAVVASRPLGSSEGGEDGELEHAAPPSRAIPAIPAARRRVSCIWRLSTKSVASVSHRSEVTGKCERGLSQRSVKVLAGGGGNRMYDAHQVTHGIARQSGWFRRT